MAPNLASSKHDLIRDMILDKKLKTNKIAKAAVSWFTGVPYLFHRFDLVVGGRRLLFSLPRIQLRILGSLSAGDS